MEGLELYKLIGATLGFVSTAIAIWDRLFRYRPSISITTEIHSGGTRPSIRLRIKNQAPYDIIIEKIWSSSPYYRIDSANTLRATLMGAYGDPGPILLAPEEERFLRIAENEINGKTASDLDLRVRFRVDWTRGDHPLFRPCPVFLWSSGRDIERRRRASELYAQETTGEG
jgi:hypothetical protein